jgi:tetratricopeptide (TPR) repeat protein
MMRPLLRILAAAIIVACASVLLWDSVVVPYRCNLRLRQQKSDIAQVFSMPTNSVRAVQLARQTAENLQPCLSACAGNIDLLMVLAANDRAMDRNPQAIAIYETALRYERRPELYLNLGQTQLANGNPQAALENLTRACIYNPAYLDDIGQFHTEIKRAVDLYQTGLLAGKRAD